MSSTYSNTPTFKHLRKLVNIQKMWCFSLPWDEKWIMKKMSLFFRTRDNEKLQRHFFDFSDFLKSYCTVEPLQGLIHSGNCLIVLLNNSHNHRLTRYFAQLAWPGVRFVTHASANLPEDSLGCAIKTMCFCFRRNPTNIIAFRQLECRRHAPRITRTTE